MKKCNNLGISSKNALNLDWIAPLVLNGRVNGKVWQVLVNLILVRS